MHGGFAPGSACKELEVRALFATYLLVSVAGLAFFVAVGLLGR
jgi:hypothetical protein